MSATNILWGQILAVSTVVLALIWAATEWTAWHLAFQPQFAQPWFVLFGWPVYQPPAFFWWWFAYDAYAHEVFVEGAYIAASSGVAAIVVAVSMSVWRAREVKRITSYALPCFAPSKPRTSNELDVASASSAIVQLGRMLSACRSIPAPYARMIVVAQSNFRILVCREGHIL